MHERGVSAQAAEIARLTHAVDDREASLIRMRDMLNQSRDDLVRLQAEGIHSCHDGCTRSGCVNARLREEKDELAKLANALLHQIDINDFQDSHGHNAKSLKAVHDLMLALTPPTGEKP